MEITFILLILGFIVATVLIFKLIKKIIFAIITFILLILMVIGSVFGLVYLDYNHLASQSDFDINLMYGTVDSPQFGVFLSVRNKSLDTENFRKYDISNLNGLDLDEVEENFYVFFSQNLFASMLSDKETYYLEGTNDLTISGVGIDAGLSKQEVLDILSSNDAKNKYLDYVLAKNDIPSFLQATAKTSAQKYIDDALSEFNLNIQEALFLSLIDDVVSADTNAIKLVQGFQNQELEIYPDRFTFKLVRMLPANMFAENIPSFEG